VTNHDQILLPESAFPMSARFDDDAMVEQKRDLLLQLGLRLGVGNRDSCPMRLQK